MTATRPIYEVRYDDDDTYYPAARYTDRVKADRLMARLVAAHQEVDKDDCDVAGYWTVAELTVDELDPEADFPADLFDSDKFGHGDVDAYRLISLEATR